MSTRRALVGLAARNGILGDDGVLGRGVLDDGLVADRQLGVGDGRPGRATRQPDHVGDA